MIFLGKIVLFKVSSAFAVHRGFSLEMTTAGSLGEQLLLGVLESKCQLILLQLYLSLHLI